MLGEDSREVAWLRELAAKYVAGRLTVDEYLDRAEKVGTGFPGLDPGVTTVAYHDGFPAGASGAYIAPAYDCHQVFRGVSWSDELNAPVDACGNGCPGPGWQWSKAALAWVPPEATETEENERGTHVTYCPECHMAPPCPTTCTRSVSQFPRPTMEER